MPVQLPSDAGVPLPTPAQDPPTIQDVYNAIKYTSNVEAARDATYEAQAQAHVYQTKVINAHVGPDIAPPRFAAAVQPIVDEIRQLNMKVDRIAVLLTETQRVAAQSYNMNCHDGSQISFKIVPFPDGSLPAEHDLPSLYSVHDIRALPALQLGRYVELYLYESPLPVPNTDAARRELLRREIRCTQSLV